LLRQDKKRLILKQISDGTLRYLLLLGVLFNHDRGCLVCIDAPRCFGHCRNRAFPELNFFPYLEHTPTFTPIIKHQAYAYQAVPFVFEP
jgi:hypothetical protein